MDTLETNLATILSRNWWLLLVRGVVAILFGVMIWLQPAISLVALVMLFGAYALADGVLGVWHAIAGRKQHEDWWILLLWGLIGVGIGIITFVMPAATGLALLLYIAIWALTSGVLEIVAAIHLRRQIRNEWLLILGGLASVLFGALLMAQPAAGALALLWVIATYAVIFGVILVLLAFRARSFGHRHRPAHP